MLSPSYSYNRSSLDIRRLVLVTPPASEPITRAEATAGQRIQVGGGSSNPANPALDLKIQAAREWAEAYTGRAFLTQTWDLLIDDGDSGGFSFTGTDLGYYGRYSADYNLRPILLPKPPLQSVVGIYTTDDYGVETLVDPATYLLSRSHAEARIALAANQFWPMHRAFEGFRIRYTCGYGDTAASVPASIRRALISLVGQEPLPTENQQPSGMMLEVMDLLRPFQVMSI